MTAKKQNNASANTLSSQTTKKEEKNITFRFAVMADCRGSDRGINTQSIKKTLECIKGLKPQPDFAIMAGDLVGGANTYAAEKEQMTYFKGIITQYYPISFFYPGFGNHESTAGTAGETAFKDVFSEFQANFLGGYNKTVYYFDKGGTRFYMLNSNHPGESHQISDMQLNWIKNNADTDIKYNFYFFHEPAYPTGAHVGNSLDVNRLQRDKLWNIIDKSLNPMAFCGHEHNYTRRHINSDFDESVNGQTFYFTKQVYQVTAGSFGAPLYTTYTSTKDVDVPPIVQYHFAIVDVYNNSVEVTVYNLKNEIIDHFKQTANS